MNALVKGSVIIVFIILTIPLIYLGLVLKVLAIIGGGDGDIFTDWWHSTILRIQCW